ncbi:MAG: hypothetical protein MJK10_10490 [Pseudomonadales bacterium]|nr:hypothetical protein [Pseudomonadales bacterium]NRA15980.1 hypothetical protein [Oceanospirillaceae bacterium]
MRTKPVALQKLLLLIWAVTLCTAVAGQGGDLKLNRSEHQQLNNIQRQLQAGNQQQGLHKLLAFVEGQPSAYARALSQQLLGGVYQQQRRLESAFLSYRQSYEFKYWPEKTRSALLVKMYKLKYALKDWQSSIDWLLLWQQSNRASALDYMLLANSYVHLQRPVAAKKALLQALAINSAAPLAWRQMLLQLEQQLQHHQHQQTLLKQLLLEYPQTQSYWLLLAKNYQSQQRSQDATATLHSAFIGQALTSPAAIHWLAASLRDQGSPMSAVTVIKQALERGLLNDLDRAKSFIASASLVAKESATNPVAPD